MGVEILLRRGTAAEWTAANPTLAQGEVGLELDTGLQKVGDGSTPWKSLPYWNRAPAAAGGLYVQAGTTAGQLSSLSFKNSNGVSFGLAGNTLTASAAGGGGAASVLISAGTTSSLRSDVTFADSNGVSWGLDTNGAVTATVATNYQSQGAYLTTAQPPGAYLTTAALSSQTLAFSLSGNTATTNSSQVSNGAFALAGGNGVTLQQSNNTVSISVATNYQSQGAYLTTAALSQNTSNYAGVNTSVATVAGTDVTLGVNTSGVTVGYPKAITTAALSSQTLAFSLSGNTATTNSSQISNGAFALAGGNNVTLQQSNNTISISVGNYITTADLSQNSSKYAGINTSVATVAGTDVAIAVNTSGVTVSYPKYITTAALSSQTLAFSLGGNSGTTNSSQILNGGYVLAGGANVTVLQSNNTISISAASAAAAPLSVSAGTTNQAIGTVIFANSNGVSFGIGTGASSQSVTATVQTNYITTGALSSQTLAFSLSGNTATTNSSQILNGGYALAGGNNVTLQQSNNTVSISVGNYITTGALSSQTLAFSLSGNTATTNSSQILNGGYALAGGNNVTLQQSNNTISISVGNYITTADLSANSSAYLQRWDLLGANTAGTTTSASLSRLQLSAENGLTLSGNSNTIRISIGAYITTADLSQNSSKYAGINSGATNCTVTVNTSGVSVSVGNYITTAMLSNAATISNVNLSAGATSANLSAFTLSNLNGVSFGLTNSVVTAMAMDMQFNYGFAMAL